jgi:alpha-mannosidase
VKKADQEAAIVLRFYESEGRAGATPVEFLGQRRSFQEVDLLEAGAGHREEEVLRVNPYQIKTIKLRITGAPK